MTRIGTRGVLLIALVAAVIGGVATYGVSALTGTAKTEVRITAQRLDDGRVEFALQEREGAGAWGERLLPTRRFFPAEGFVNHWANSSPIEIDSGIPFYVNTTEPERSLTIDEYVASCGVDGDLLADSGLVDEDDITRFQLMQLDEGEDATWGLLLAVADLGLTAMKAIEPPDELAEYHSAQISLLTLFAQYAFAQPSDAPFNPWELLGIGLIAAGLSQQAEENLDPELHDRLTDGGCIESEDGAADG